MRSPLDCGILLRLHPNAEIYNKGERAKLTPPALLGLSHDYPNMSTWIAQELIPETAAEFRKADSQCFDSNAKLFAFQDIGKYFKRGWKSIVEDAVPRSVMASGCRSIITLVFRSRLTVEASMGVRATPNVPWYLYEVGRAAFE